MMSNHSDTNSVSATSLRDGTTFHYGTDISESEESALESGPMVTFSITNVRQRAAWRTSSLK
jgi:hypothetical protein